MAEGKVTIAFDLFVLSQNVFAQSTYMAISQYLFDEQLSEEMVHCGIQLITSALLDPNTLYCGIYSDVPWLAYEPLTNQNCYRAV